MRLDYTALFTFLHLQNTETLQFYSSFYSTVSTIQKSEKSSKENSLLELIQPNTLLF